MATAHQAGNETAADQPGADPVAAAGHAAAMTSLKRRSNEWARVRTWNSVMIVSNVYLNCDDAIAYRESAGPEPDPRNGHGATHRLYETSPSARDAELAPH